VGIELSPDARRPRSLVAQAAEIATPVCAEVMLGEEPDPDTDPVLHDLWIFRYVC
jgi:hypothetical protein